MRASLILVSFLALAVAVRLPAQVVERPVPFDSAGRVMTIAPSLAARLGLGAPVWPVSGDYVEARLFDRGGGFVLVVTCNAGVVERYELTTEARASLARAVTAAMASTGNLTTGERLDVISEPAKGQFVRNQTLASVLIYGPAMAALVDDGAAATALYLSTAGITFFVSEQIASSRSISKAQNHMSTDGAWRGAAIGGGVRYVFGGSDGSGKTAASSILAGSLIGSTVGFGAGRPFTDGEAHAATFGSTFTAGLGAGIIGSAGGFKGDHARGEVAAIIGAALVGYPIGLKYARRAHYGVTAGDVGALSAAALVGVAGATTLIADGDPGGKTIAATLTAGLIGGTLVGDRIVVRPFDLTESEGNLVRLGAVAGALVAIAIPAAASSENGRVYFGLASLGAAVGMAITMGMIEPKRGQMAGPQGAVMAPANSWGRGRGRGSPAVTLSLQNAALLLWRTPGRMNVPLVAVRF